MSVKDKVAIVTGGGTGLGAAVSTRLAAEGARVAVNYSRSAAEAEACCTAIGHAGGEAVAIQADVASDADCRRLAAEVLARWGRIDILVNNAGITRFADQADLDALDAEDFVDIYRVNVVGAYQMVRACAPAMRAAEATASSRVPSWSTSPRSRACVPVHTRPCAMSSTSAVVMPRYSATSPMNCSYPCSMTDWMTRRADSGSSRSARNAPASGVTPKPLAAPTKQRARARARRAICWPAIG